jgi:type I restriction enzyme S subunit
MKLNDIAEFVTDKISSSGISLDRYVTTDSLLQNRRGRETAQNLPPMPCALTHYRQGDVLVANIRPYLKKVWYADSEGGCSSDVLAFRAKNGHCPSFLYTVLMQDAFFDYAMSGAKGSKMPRGDKDQIMRYELPTFTPLEEENIGNMMVDIMSKINVNRQINDNLEEMAKQLYDYWFVQFDFPNEEGMPYKSSGGEMVWNEKLKREIPKGWEVKHLGDIIETNRGISYNTSSISGGGVPMINLASFNVNGTYKDAGIKTYNGSYTKEKVLKPFDLVLCNTQQTAIDFSKDIIGKAFLVPDVFEGDIVSSHHINTIKTEDYYKAYIAYLSNTSHFHKYTAGCCSGTNILGLDFNSFSQYKMEIPPVYLLEEFQKIIIDIVKRESVIIKENKTLTKLRDELLPLLMNGQATVNYHLSAC